MGSSGSNVSGQSGLPFGVKKGSGSPAPPFAFPPLPDTSTGSTVQIEQDESLWCYCQQVSYGDMVGCDNDDCPVEWFHYACVGLTEAPKGKWFCKECKEQMAKKKGRHKKD